MNHAEQQPSTVSDAAIDRLVAGELPDPERRDLLLSLESDIDGWRRCALAFLEDQAWRSALATPALMTPKVEPLHPRPGQPRARRPIARLAAAASLLAATFAAGLHLGRAPREKLPVGMDRPPVIARNQPDPVAAAERIREVGWVDLVDSSTGELPPRRVPILSGPGLDDRWLSRQPSSVPDYVRAVWERQGYQVEEHRRLVSVTLADGRRVSIPVEEVALDYVGQETF